MCGGGGGILGGIGSLLFGSGPKAPEMPAPAAPAVPAPSRKQDTGAMVRVGEAQATDDRLSGGTKKKVGIGSMGRSGSSGLGL